MKRGRRVRLGLAAAWLGLALGSASAASAGAPPPLPQTELVQHLDVALPLDLAFVDANGRNVHLADYFGGVRPVVLVLGYYRCPNLCGLAMHGVLEALAASGLPPSDYRVVGVSIDPDEMPADAMARQRIDLDYASHLREGGAGGLGDDAIAPLDLQLLVGRPASVTALARRIGFGYEVDDTASAGAIAADPDRARSRYVHAAGFVVVTPAGRTSRYLLGVRFEPRDLRLALVEAASGRIGSLSDRLVLLCAHFDPASGRYDGAVMNLMRGIGLVLVLGLGGWAWRHRRLPAREAAR